MGFSYVPVDNLKEHIIRGHYWEVYIWYIYTVVPLIIYKECYSLLTFDLIQKSVYIDPVATEDSETEMWSH